MSRRKICVVTATRAEYGLLYWLLKELQDDPQADLQLVVTGTHLSPEFGYTYRQIEKDGFTIHKKIESVLSSDSGVGVAKTMGLIAISFSDVLQELSPDLIVILGDRTELLAIAQVATVLKIPIAHIFGGEITMGAVDDSIRHAITKLSHLHFVAASPYRNRVIQLGENPERVFNFGAPSVDNIFNLELFSKDEISRETSFPVDSNTYLVTYHPVTLAPDLGLSGLNEMLSAFDIFQDKKIIFSMSNSDEGGREITKIIQEYIHKNSERAVGFFSLGQLKYLSVMKNCGAVIGNSSSGIIEAPILKKPVVNIGDRQKGRLRAATIVDCEPTRDAIAHAIHLIHSENFMENISEEVSPYYSGKNVSQKIKNVLVTADLSVEKEFYDF